MIKYEVNLLDHVDMIRLADEVKRKQVLAVFKKHGITKLPDGRKMEDVVKTAGF